MRDTYTVVLSQLEAVVEVARLGSVSHAAAALSVTQPAVTWRLKSLEAELGGELFVRTRRGVRLTGMGRALLPHAQRAVQAAADAERAAREHADDGAEVLSLASIAGISLTVLPLALRELSDGYPSLRISVRTTRSDAIADLVIREEVQVGLTVDLQHPDLTRIPLFDDPVVAVTAAGKSRRAPGTASEETLVMVDPRPTYQRLLRQFMREAGLAPRRVIQLDTLEAGVRTVAQGLGMAFLPRSHVVHALASGALREIPLPVPDSLTRHLVAVRKADAGPRPDHVDALIDGIRRAAGIT